jgi:hypothetical protein
VSELVGDLLGDDNKWTIAGTLAAQAVGIGSIFCKAGIDMTRSVIPDLLHSPLIRSASMQQRVLRLVGPFVTSLSVNSYPSVAGGWVAYVKPNWYDPYSYAQGKYVLWYRFHRGNEAWSRWYESPSAEQLHLVPDQTVEFAVRVTDALGIMSPYGYSGPYTLGYS